MQPVSVEEKKSSSRATTKKMHFVFYEYSREGSVPVSDSQNSRAEDQIYSNETLRPPRKHDCFQVMS